MSPPAATRDRSGGSSTALRPVAGYAALPPGPCRSARSAAVNTAQTVCSRAPDPARAAVTDRCGKRSGTTAVGPCRAAPTSSEVRIGPAPRPALRALGHDLGTGAASASHRHRRSALHEALPHIRKEISQ